MKLEAQETIWRDFYTGQRLYKNWSKPYLDDKNDTTFGKFDNCMAAYTDEPWEKSWFEWQCVGSDMSCPCIYPRKPLLTLRGLCEESWIDKRYTLKQMQDGTIFLLGQYSIRLEYDEYIGKGERWKKGFLGLQ